MTDREPTTEPPVPFTYQVLVMPSDEGFEAVALKMGQWGFGETSEEAFDELVGNVEAHVADAVERGQLELLDCPAPERYQAIASYLRNEAPPTDRFARTLPLPVPDVHHAA